MQRLVALARIHNILLVSDTPQFAARGGHVEIFPAAENLRFRVNLRELGRSGVSLSSKVLRLAEIVDGDGRK